jgi:hypothetical protein
VTPAEIRAELQRRAGNIQPVIAYAIDGIVHDHHKEADSFCLDCAEKIAEAGGTIVEDDDEGDGLRWCRECDALLDWRIIGTEGVIEEIDHYEEKPPSEPAHWADLLLAMAEIPPEDWRGPEDEEVESSPLWARVEAILMKSKATG